MSVRLDHAAQAASEPPCRRDPAPAIHTTILLNIIYVHAPSTIHSAHEVSLRQDRTRALAFRPRAPAPYSTAAGRHRHTAATRRVQHTP